MVAANTYAQNNLLNPEEFLGYSLGDRFTRHDQIISYFKHVDEVTDHVSIQIYGESNEHRPLMVAYITAPEHAGQLEEIRKHHLGEIGVEEKTSLDKELAIVWLSYNVHGNEAVSSEAVMDVLHRLADEENTSARQWLQNTIVILDPCLNPDGRERYVSWYNRTVGELNNPNPESVEHHEPWPGGRTNHYLFDLNRDWTWLSQKETRQRIALYNQWLPHIHADYHEQGVNSPYYFAPAAEPYHNFITNWQREFQVVIGKNNAKYFDEKGWLYFTRERFDLFYPGYGDTYPIYNGAIGMTYEQGGSGRAGLAVVMENADTLTLKDRIAHHVSTSLSTIEATANQHTKVIENFKLFYNEGLTNPKGTYKSYVIKTAGNEDKVKALKTLFKSHKIQYGTTSASPKSLNGFSYTDNRNVSFQLQDSDLVVSAYQPKSTLVQILFDPKPNLSDSITYDITSWALPYSYGLEAYALTSPLEVNPEAEARPIVNNEPVKDTYAYLLPWNSVEDARLLAKALNSKIKARYASEPFVLEGQNYAPGTLLFTRADNRNNQSFEEALIQVANTLNKKLIPVQTGYSGNGIDIGSNKMRFIEVPKVILLTNEPVSSYAFGEAWHFLDSKLRFPITIVRAKELNTVKLNDYNTIIMPSGSYSLEKEMQDKLQGWIKSGGKVIAMEKAVNTFLNSEEYKLEKYADEEEKQRLEKIEEERQEYNKTAPYGGEERRQISNYISGSVFKLTIDNTHPLGFGLPQYYHSLKRSGTRAALLPKGWNVGYIQNAAQARVSGFAGAESLRELNNSLTFGVEEVGRGEVVYLLDDPLFRGFWYNGELVFSNALFLVGN